MNHLLFQSVLEQIQIKGLYLDQRLSQHESLKSARIEIPHGRPCTVGTTTKIFQKLIFTNTKTALQ